MQSACRWPAASARADVPHCCTQRTQRPRRPPAVDLSEVKAYLLDQAATLKANTAALKAASDDYFALAESHDFDYAALWATMPLPCAQCSNKPVALGLRLAPIMKRWKELSPAHPPWPTSM
ncbi:MAG: hypothetical protein R2867_26385 [Caldilineaceae bacterium]